jgi:hypothetical protein
MLAPVLRIDVGVSVAVFFESWDQIALKSVILDQALAG